MTAAADLDVDVDVESEEETPLSPRLRVPPRVVVIAACVVVLAVVGLFGFSYWRARVQLADKRAQLNEATARLADVRDNLDQVRQEHTATQNELDQIQADIALAIDTRTWIDALTANAQTEIVAVDANRTQVDNARWLIAANSNEARACFDGVSQAVRASRGGDDQTSVGALRGVIAHCTHTLAYATGARFPFDFADPFVLRAGGAYYGYSTNSGAGDIQVIRSANLVDWELVGNALAGLPGWASPHATWAPSVLPRGGGYVVYYTVREAATQRQCISRAVASSPAGPFRDDSAGPLMCQFGGSIDPSPFVDADGRAYLLWKAEAVGDVPPVIWSQELTGDGLGLTVSAQQLLSVDRSFERGVVEAPSMVREGGTYFLLYAAADWNSRNYSTAYATCAGPAGPCTKPADGRILTSGQRIAGPGGVEVFRAADASLWAAFHAFSEPNVGYPSSRYLHLAQVHITNGHITLDPNGN
ncbi:MAG TPA: family 43 glycosylhydrolase [Acidimicrobiales bacterium]